MAALGKRRHDGLPAIHIASIARRLYSLATLPAVCSLATPWTVPQGLQTLYGLVDSGSYCFHTYTQAFRGIGLQPLALDELLLLVT
jgi:hypothetical protein